MRRWLAGLVLAAALAAGLAPAANAGTYRVYVCQLPDGRAIPLQGWETSSNARGALSFDQCATGGGFGVRLYSQDSNPVAFWKGYDQASFATGLLDVTLLSVKLRRTAQARDPALETTDASASPQASIEYAGQVLEQCLYPACTTLGTPASANNPNNQQLFSPPAPAPPVSSRVLRFTVRCSGAADGTCAGSDAGDLRAELRVYRAELELRDDAAPISQNLEGTLTDDAPLAGDATLSLYASDGGSGVREAIVEIAGNEVARQAQSSASCQDVGYSSDPHEYASVKPCPILAPFGFTLDTRTLPNGTHRLKLRVRDASGNESLGLDRQIVIANPVPADGGSGGGGAGGGGGNLGGSGGAPGVGDPGGSGANGVVVDRLAGASLALDRSSRGSLRVPYRRARMITGTLVDAAKAPIAGATVAVAGRVGLPGTLWAPDGTVTTDGKGRFSFKITPTGSRVLRFTAGPSSVEARVGVLAKMTVRASKAIRRRGTLQMAGNVTVDQLPRRGVRVEIQSRWGSAWRTIDSVQTSKTGAWKWKYRVERATGALPFRAVLVPADNVPAAGGTSPTVKVRVR